MKFYEGRLKRLGDSVINPGATVYSLIEIGDEILTKVAVNNKLNNFLKDGLATTEPVKIWTIKLGLTARSLVAIQLPNGKKYIARPFSIGFYIMSLLQVLFAASIAASFGMIYIIPVLVISFLILYPLYDFTQVPSYDAIKL